MYFQNILYKQDIKLSLCSVFEKLKNSTFFITGASGLVGSALIDVLRYLNEYHNYQIKIYGVFSSEKSLYARFPDYNNISNFYPVIQNIMDKIKCDVYADFVVHAASNTHPKLYAEVPVETMLLNFLGTNNVLEYARKNSSSKSIFISTLEVYGENEQKELYSETDYGYIDITAPRSCYPESKRAAETLCCSYSQEYNMDVMIARLGYIYGPTVKLSSSKADVQFLNKVLHNEDIILKSSGLQRRSYCYVMDVVAALLFMLCSAQKGEAYNIANPKGNVCLKDVAQTLARLGNVNVRFEIPSDVEKQGYSTVSNSTLDSSKLMQLGWKPKFSLEEGLSHTLQIKRDMDNVG